MLNPQQFEPTKVNSGGERNGAGVDQPPFRAAPVRGDLSDDRGAGLAEYALLLLLIVIAAVLALTALGTTISSMYQNITTNF